MLTIYQAQKLIEINESAKEIEKKEKDLKINYLSWEEIQELT